jgi:hypothetical protein
MSDDPILHNADSSGANHRPFTVLHERLDIELSGAFRPGASVTFTAALRTSGFLQSLPPEDLKNLLFVLTFVTANGWITPSVEQLADAMHISSGKVLNRMAHLAAHSWRGEPVIHAVKHENGLQTFAPGRSIIGNEDAPPEQVTVADIPVAVGSREEVIAYSRAHYARPRAVVEREIAIMNGWPLPEELSGATVPDIVLETDGSHLDPAVVEIRRRLLGMNVPVDEVDTLISKYDLPRIERQLAWLPYRNAKSRGRFIVAAIEGDYEEPVSLRVKRTQSETGVLTVPPDAPPIS